MTRLIGFLLIAVAALAVACSQTSPEPAATPTSEPISPTATVEPTIAPTVGSSPTPPPVSTALPTLVPTPRPATPGPKPPGNPSTGTATPIALDEPPVRDLFDLAQRFNEPPGVELPRTVNPDLASYEVGHVGMFWVSDLFNQDSYSIQATLRLVSDNAYWYVDSSVSLDIDDLEKAAEAFENKIHPTVVNSIGDVWNPGVDNDPRITILHTPLRGVAGYYGSRDQYTRQIHPRSNEREMLYMNTSGLRPGSSEYLGVLTHELQHAVHWNLDAGEDSWVNEGMAELVKELAGYRASFIDSFLRKSDTQLNFWPNSPGETPAHYGAGNLFLAYTAQRFGGYENLKSLVEQPGDSDKGIDAYLSDFGTTFREVFKDWVVANYLDADEGIYRYPDRSVRTSDLLVLVSGGNVEEQLPQFSARYALLALKQGDALVEFQGETQVTQVGTQCHSGRSCWWGNRGDSIDSMLTQEFDLSGLDSATLEFWTWFQTEKDWDYAYVAVSTDGGGRWKTLKGSLTTSTNPNGNNIGEGFTGETNGWLQEKIDLTPFAGNKVLIRFEYVTDDAVHTDGFVIDDIAIPELDFFDDAEQNKGWNARGFLRFENVLSQEYIVQIIEETADGDITVREIELDESNRGEALIQGFGSELDEAVVIVSPVTKDTSHPARYTLTVTTR